MRINNKFVAPNFDRLICCFDNHYRNSSKPSKELSEAIDELFDLVKNIKPLRENFFGKSIVKRKRTHSMD